MSEHWPRIVVHADMDAFYAAVEQLDDERLRGIPILVGSPANRGVVLTASYEARPYGVGSAMPMARARQLCPHAQIVPPRFERYQQLSERIMDVFEDFSPDVEALSLDEAFLEMSGAEALFGGPRAMGEKLKSAVFEATGGLCVSVGVSGTKYVAKVASAACKPDGLLLVPQAEALEWLAPLPLSRLWGAGRKTQQRLERLGFATIGDIAAADPEMLEDKLGSAGRHFHDLAHARDPRRVHHRRHAHSIGSDRTLETDVSERHDIETCLLRSADAIGRRLRAKRYLAAGVRVRLKTSKFELFTRQRRLAEPSDVAGVLHAAAVSLLDRFDTRGPFRLVGMAAFDLIRAAGPQQMDLLNAGVTDRQRRLESAIDDLAERYGSGTVKRANQIADPCSHRLAPNLDFLDPEDHDS